MGGRAWRRWISPRRSEPRTNTSALDTAVRFLAQRPRSEYEVRQRLRRAGVDEATAEGVLEQLRRHQLVDDRAFAEYWVEQRQTHRPRGARLLRAELTRLGVPREGSEAVTAPLEGSAAADAYRAASRRAAQLHRLGLDERTFAARLGQWLARRGFDWDAIATVVQRLWDENARLDDQDDQ
jgi:regulatory protein